MIKTFVFAITALFGTEQLPTTFDVLCYGPEDASPTSYECEIVSHKGAKDPQTCKEFSVSEVVPMSREQAPLTLQMTCREFEKYLELGAVVSSAKGPVYERTQSVEVVPTGIVFDAEE